MAKELKELGKWEVGQAVVIEGFRGSLRIRCIERITDGRGGTIYVDGVSFRQSGSQRGGDGWHFLHIKIATNEDRIKIKGMNSRQKLCQYKWQTLELEKAIEIEKLLEENGIDLTTH